VQAVSDEIQVIDLFSGCGGMTYGFANAKTENVNYVVRGGLDNDPHAVATFKRAFGVESLQWNVSDLLKKQKLNEARRLWNLDSEKPLLLIGCAPCQGFSSHRKKDSNRDQRNSLLETFGKVVVQLKPEIVVMENVPEIFQFRHWSHFEKWRNTVEQAGYTVRAQIHNLAQFGVPQERFRALVIATRSEHFGMPNPTHQPDNYLTVADAIGHLRPLKAGGRDPDDEMHMTSRHRKETVDLLSLIPKNGGSRRSLPPGVGPKCLQKVDGFRDVYGRLWWDKPSVAITARCRTPSCGRFTHPDQDRGLSVREAALLQGFPQDFYFEGPFDDKFKQIGNAVSPIFSLAIAKYIDRALYRSCEPNVGEYESEDITTPFAKSFSSSIASIKKRQRASNSFGVANAAKV
jgi:DNA (cytosine-5)-methyltransferase 1